MLPIAPDIASPIQQQLWITICGLVHDLRQPLSVIGACADYLDLVVPDANAPAHRQLDLLQQQVAEVNRVLHEALLQVNHGQAPPRKPVAMAAAANAAGCELAVG